MDYNEILLIQIPETGLVLNVKLDAAELAENNSTDLNFSGDVLFKGMIRPVSNRYILSGRLTANTQFTCDRCLCEFQFPIEQDFTVSYLVQKNIGVDRVIESEDGNGLEDIVGTSINLKEALLEQIVLQIPMKTICSDNCKGLCSQCGNDLNKGECGCDRRSIDPRLLKLKDLLEK